MQRWKKYHSLEGIGLKLYDCGHIIKVAYYVLSNPSLLLILIVFGSWKYMVLEIMQFDINIISQWEIHITYKLYAITDSDELKNK